MPVKLSIVALHTFCQKSFLKERILEFGQKLTKAASHFHVSTVDFNAMIVLASGS